MLRMMLAYFFSAAVETAASDSSGWCNMALPRSKNYPLHRDQQSTLSAAIVSWKLRARSTLKHSKLEKAPRVSWYAVKSANPVFSLSTKVLRPTSLLSVLNKPT